jgi:hypothetical protein
MVWKVCNFKDGIKIGQMKDESRKIIPVNAQRSGFWKLSYYKGEVCPVPP